MFVLIVEWMWSENALLLNAWQTNLQKVSTLNFWTGLPYFTFIFQGKKFYSWYCLLIPTPPCNIPLRRFNSQPCNGNLKFYHKKSIKKFSGAFYWRIYLTTREWLCTTPPFFGGICLLKWMKTTWNLCRAMFYLIFCCSRCIKLLWSLF